MRGGEGRVVAPDFGAGLLRVVEKVEIVDRHDLRRARRGYEKRMRGMDDIGMARKPLDRRPPGPVPEQVEHLHRYPPIDHPRCRGEAGVGTVLPRTGEERHLAGIRGHIRMDQPMHVFADAGALAQRRPVIDENFHLEGYDSLDGWSGERASKVPESG